MDVHAEMTMGDYVSVVRRRKRIVAAAVLVLALVALVSTALRTPIYAASSEVLVQPRGSDGLFEDRRVEVNDRSIQTEVQVIEGQQVRERVRSDLTLEELPPSVNATAVTGTDVIELVVRDASASRAAMLADAYAAAYIEVRREQSVGELEAASAEVEAAMESLQSQIDALAVDDRGRSSLVAQLVSLNTTLDQLRVDAALRTGGAVVVKSAQVPDDPVEPTPIRTVGLAVVVGVVLGLAIAFVVEHLDDKIRSDRDLSRIARFPVLAVVPVDPPPDHRPIALSEPGHVAVEAFRGLRTSVRFLGLDRDIRIIQLTSSVAGEGKTTTASNLAVVLAQAGHDVAIVDADLRRPRLHDVFDVPQAPGLTDLLVGRHTLDVGHQVPVDAVNRLSVYTSGPVPSNSSELVSSRAARRVFEQLSKRHDYVIVDSAPILPVSDSVALSRWVHGVIVVAHAGRVKESDVTETLDRLDRVGAVVLGTVLNQAMTTRGTYFTTHGRHPSGDNDRESVFAPSGGRGVESADDWTARPPTTISVRAER